MPDSLTHLLKILKLGYRFAPSEALVSESGTSQGLFIALRDHLRHRFSLQLAVEFESLPHFYR
jgi:hypothetical protein